MRRPGRLAYGLSVGRANQVNAVWVDGELVAVGDSVEIRTGIPALFESGERDEWGDSDG